MKLSRKKTKRQVYVCLGGPWSGKMVLMPHETMKFTIGDFKGFYCKGYWSDV